MSIRFALHYFHSQRENCKWLQLCISLKRGERIIQVYSDYKCTLSNLQGKGILFWKYWRNFILANFFSHNLQPNIEIRGQQVILIFINNMLYSQSKDELRISHYKVSLSPFCFESKSDMSRLFVINTKPFCTEYSAKTVLY